MDYLAPRKIVSKPDPKCTTWSFLTPSPGSIPTVNYRILYDEEHTPDRGHLLPRPADILSSDSISTTAR